MIVRAIALKNATETGTTCSCTGAGEGTIKDLGGRACDVTLYGGLEILSSVGNGIKVWVQANSSSGYTALNTGTDIIAYTSRTCRDSQFQRIPWNCASATSTDRKFYRLAWSQTCNQEQKYLGAVSVE